MKYVLIIGAKSDIARSLSRVYAREGYSLYLAGRKIYELENFQEELEKNFNINVKLIEFDVLDFESHGKLLEILEPKPEGVIYVAGYLPDQGKCEESLQETLITINVNYTAAVSLLNIFAKHFEKSGPGFIIGISSVAGDRGRKSNYIYGSAKAGFSTYLSGLRAKLYRHNVHVLTVKPGFVRTKMTKHLKLPPLITAEPDEVAEKIFIANKKKKDIVYIRGIWRIIMFMVKIIPEKLFKRLDF